MNASNTTKFQDAVKQIEQFFRKPQVNSLICALHDLMHLFLNISFIFFQTLSSDGPVKVKIEADDGNDIQFETIAIAKASKEKKDIYKNLTSEILSLKEANNAMYYDLQKTKESTKLLETENQQLKAVNFSLLEKQKKCQTAEDELNRLKSELGDTKNQLVETKKENKILQARCREFQMGIDQSKQAYKHKEKENQDEQHYEVEEILAHKNHRKGRAYLIRWRGYTSIDDRWVKESDMFCPDILNAYKKSHNLN